MLSKVCVLCEVKLHGLSCCLSLVHNAVVRLLGLVRKHPPNLPELQNPRGSDSACAYFKCSEPVFPSRAMGTYSSEDLLMAANTAEEQN